LQTIARTLTELLSQPQRLLVPMFQRSYAWERDLQWQPLWDDVLHMLELAEQGSAERHFLGAIVLQSAQLQPGGLQAWDVIDGQQRLTTLQVLLDAVAGVLAGEVDGGEMLSRRLLSLTENDRAFRASEAERFKLLPTTKDAHAFHEVMAADAAVSPSALTHHEHRLAKAHKFFTDACRTLMSGIEAGGQPLAAARLADVLMSRLEMVVISLEQTENAQGIFETLNARMTPLQPTDLIKNFVFQRAAQEDEDVTRLYESIWRQFEDDFWETEVRQGQFSRPRFTAFTNHWVSAKLQQTVPAADVFRAFKRAVQADASSIAAQLGNFAASAQQYRALVEAADSSATIEGRALTIYRLQEVDVGTFWPFFLHLLSIEDARVDARLAASVDRAFAMVESWTIRKVLLGQPLTQAPRRAIELVQAIETEETDPAAVVEEHLASGSGLAAWPDDGMLLDELPTMRIYRRLRRSRLRMLLEALEDDARGFVEGHARTAHARMTRHTSQVEHIMPEQWEKNWPLGDRTADERDRIVQTLGNLALLPQRFNGSVGNLGWGEKRGDGKRAAFHRSSADLLLHDVLEEEDWDEAAIERRTDRLIEGILRTWPAPEGHAVTAERGTKMAQGTDVQFLLDQGRIRPGAALWGRGRWSDKRATVLEDGSIEFEGRAYLTPTAAAKAARGDNRTVSGPAFWRLGTDGPTLMDIRAELIGWQGVATNRTDTPVARKWALLRRLLDALPSGRWTTYGDLASIVGTHANPLGQYIAANEVPNAWRVLQASGTPSPGFAWAPGSPHTGTRPMELLAREGVPVENGRASSSHRLRGDELRGLLDAEGQASLNALLEAQPATPASLADEFGVRPELVRDVLRSNASADAPRPGAEWVIDAQMAAWVRTQLGGRLEPGQPVTRTV